MLTATDLLWLILVVLCVITGPVGWLLLAIVAGAALLKWSWEGLTRR